MNHVSINQERGLGRENQFETFSYLRLIQKGVRESKKCRTRYCTPLSNYLHQPSHCYMMGKDKDHFLSLNRMETPDYTSEHSNKKPKVPRGEYQKVTPQALP